MNLFDNNLNESFLRTISATKRKSSDSSTSGRESKLNSTQQNSLNQSTYKDTQTSENPRPRRLSTAKKSKKEQN